MTTTYNTFDSASGLTLENATVSGGVVATTGGSLVSRTTGSFTPGSSAISTALANLAKKPGNGQAWLQVSADGSTWKNIDGDDVSNTGCYSFDGIDDQGTVTNHADFQPGTGAFTASCWVCLANSNQYGLIFGCRQTTGNAPEWGIYVAGAATGTTTGKKVRLVLRESGSIERRRLSAADIFDGAWHHLGMVSTGSALTIYVDGIAIGTTSSDTGVAWPNVAPTTDPVTVGGAATLWVAGKIDEVRWKKGTAYSAAQMLDLAKRRHAPTTDTAWWKLDGNGTDSAGSHTMTLTGASSVTDFALLPTFGERLVSDSSTALQGTWDGVDDKLSRAYNAAFHSASTLSVSAWIMSKSTSATRQDICSRYKATGNHRGWLMGIIPSTGKLQVVLTSDGGGTNVKNYSSSITGLSDGNWHHVAFTWNSGTLKLYIDGVEDTTPTKTTDAAITTIYNPTTNADFIIGAIADPGASNWFAGSIADVALWNDVRTGAELTASAAAGYEDHANGNLIVYYPLGYAGSLLTDLGPNGFTLTASGPTSAERWGRPMPTLVEESFDLSALSLTTVAHWRLILESPLTTRTAAVESIGVDYTAAVGGNRRRRLLLGAA